MQILIKGVNIIAKKNNILTKISYLYYIDNYSQREIARQLNLSRSKVSRLLQEARDKGIVKIEIQSAETRNFELEKQLKEIYGLEEVIVVSSYSNKEENLLKSIGKAAANYLVHAAKDGMTIAFSMGKTLSNVADHVETQSNIDCKIVPITGGIGHVSPEIHANEICRRVAEGLGGVLYPLYAPAIVADKQIKELLTNDPMIQKVFHIATNADITFVSVGNVTSSTFVRIGSITQEEANDLERLGVVGDIASRFINQNGEILDLDIHQRVVGPDFIKIRENSKVVLVAGTKEKAKVILAALKGNFADILITDESAAYPLIENAYL